jgi:putative transposase
LGLTHFAITSDGSKFDNPKILNKHEKNLKKKQQDLSRKVKGSSNRTKSRKFVARVHKKITNCREDFLHKLSRRIVNENQVISIRKIPATNSIPPTPLIKGGKGGSLIPKFKGNDIICVENLNVKGMMQNHCLAKSIHQVGWGMFCTMLKYKAEQEGKVYQEVDRFFPSSKTCHVCLNQVGSLPLDIRTWTCSQCNTTHDRDVNAAINLRDEGLRILTSGTGDKAYCPDVRPTSRGRKKSTIKLSVG